MKIKSPPIKKIPRRNFVALLLLLPLIFCLANIYGTFNATIKSMEAAFQRKAQGREFNCGMADRCRLISLARRYSKSNDRIFLWFPEHTRANTGVESDAAFLRYFMYPSLVCYLNDDKIPSSNLIIAQSGVKILLEILLKQKNLDKRFIQLAEMEGFVVFRRKE